MWNRPSWILPAHVWYTPSKPVIPTVMGGGELHHQLNYCSKLLFVQTMMMGKCMANASVFAPGVILGQFHRCSVMSHAQLWTHCTCFQYQTLPVPTSDRFTLVSGTSRSEVGHYVPRAASIFSCTGKKKKKLLVLLLQQGLQTLHRFIRQRVELLPPVMYFSTVGFHSYTERCHSASRTLRKKLPMCYHVVIMYSWTNWQLPGQCCPLGKSSFAPHEDISCTPLCCEFQN